MENCEDYQELLGRTSIQCKSFEEIFEEYNDENNFIFLDPPYDSTFTNYGYCKFDKNDHQRLANIIGGTKNKCLMVIGKTEFISDLYKDKPFHIVEEFDKKYRFKIHLKRVGNEINNKHLIITNYEIPS